MNPTTPAVSLAEEFTKAASVWRELAESPVPVFRVGAATCGRAAGATKVLERLREEVKKRGIEARIVEVGCYGPCSLEPLVLVQKPGAPGICYGRVGPKEISAIVERWLGKGDPCAEWALGTMGPGSLDTVRPLEEHPMLRRQVRNILGNCGLIDPENVHHYLARQGYRGFEKALALGPEGVLGVVKAAGLRGRGGAGFPTWRKWETCRAQAEKTRYLICNADEGDPGAFMNRSLIESDPHAVLEGMLIAAYTLGASKGYVYCRAEYPLAIVRLEKALGQMRELGLLGENVLGSGFDVEITVKRGAGAFVCGEETALIASIEGKRGMPRPRPPFPAEKGLWGKPTVINNVETLGSLPLILRHGADWYAQWGTVSSRGTKTLSLTGKVALTGLIEVPLGTTLRQVVEEIGGGIEGGKALKAVQTGGPSGGCIPADKIDTPVDYEALAAAGSIMGSGGMVVLDEDTCAVDLARYFLNFTQAESCGKCPPCRVGTRATLNILEKITRGDGEPGDLVQLERLAKTIKDASLCGLGQTAPNPVLTTLKAFRQEYLEHVEQKQCRSFVCKDLIRFHIDAAKCEGCGACIKVCPQEAIKGEKDQPHVITQESCIYCGSCQAVCPGHRAAIFRTSGDLVRLEKTRELATKGAH